MFIFSFSGCQNFNPDAVANHLKSWIYPRHHKEDRQEKHSEPSLKLSIAAMASRGVTFSKWIVNGKMVNSDQRRQGSFLGFTPFPVKNGSNDFIEIRCAVISDEANKIRFVPDYDVQWVGEA